MPGPQVTSFSGDATLPDKVDIVVIGGGVIGAYTALELSERGHRVLLLEKGTIGGEQSSRNWGWVRVAMRDMREVPLMAEAIRLWQRMDARLEAATGYVRAGITFACETEASEKSHEDWLRDYGAAGFHDAPGLDGRMAMIGREGISRHFPGLSTRAGSALHASVDGRAEPQWVAPAVASAARRHGAAVVTGCAALGLQWQAGRIAGVETERGRVDCQAVVLAGGVWSGAFARLEGLDLPQLKVVNTVIRTTPLPGGPDGALWTDRFAFRRRADGGYTIASASENVFEIVPDSFRHFTRFFTVMKQEWKTLRPRLSRVWLDEWLSLARGAPASRALLTKYRTLDPDPASPTVVRAFDVLKRDYPAFGSVHAIQEWAGMIDVTPDAVPIISKVEGREGLVIATGFSGHGFGISPGAGKLAADLACNDIPVVDPHPLRFSRFHDGSPITVMGGV